MTRRFVFVGVTTGQSSIMQIFPRWRDRLSFGADVEIVGHDLPLHAEPERYRETVQWFRTDPSVVGGLVTTHKMDLYDAAHDLFDDLDEYAGLLHEVSCIGKRDGLLLGWATDPISAGHTLRDMLGPGYFGASGGHVLCFGAGGAGHAIVLDLAGQADEADRPRGLTVTDTSADRLQSLQALLERQGSDVPLQCVQNGDPRRNDELVADLPAGSLVINATGMGKDLPGSPVTDAVRFPARSVAWELNYRGALDFLRQARAQSPSLDVRLEDGWQYFIWGWTTVIERVFDRPISAEEMQALTTDAEFARPKDAGRAGSERS
jgi:shikimate 5-dehydrogenase